jgi:hypothetical protein
LLFLGEEGLGFSDVLITLNITLKSFHHYYHPPQSGIIGPSANMPKWHIQQNVSMDLESYSNNGPQADGLKKAIKRRAYK